MADISDVMDLLERLVLQAVYPNGTNAPSVTGAPVSVAQGWPPSAVVDSEIGKGNALCSIYPEPSSTSAHDTPINSNYVAQQPVIGITVTVVDPTATFGGTPTVGDVAVLILDGKGLPYTIQTNDTPASVATALLALVLPTHPDAYVIGTSITVASAHLVQAGLSGTGMIANKIHTQRTQFQLVTWAPSAAVRSKVASAVDVVVKAQVRQNLPDTTCALLSYQGTNLRDREEKQGVFRRDVLVNVVYQTIQLVPAQKVVVVSR